VARSLAEKNVDGATYRIARKPGTWEWPDWQYVADDGNRWDDPQKIYRVLYTSSSILGCFLEVLARFRPNPNLIEAFDEILENDDHLPLTEEPGTVPMEWLNARRLAEAPDIQGTFAALGHSESLACLNRDLVGLVKAHGLEELDGAAIRQKAPRALTQAISAYVYNSVTSAGSQYAGIYYLSRWGDDIGNLALFEGDGRWYVREILLSDLDKYMDEFGRAIAMHGIKLGST
jgi:hypothetical protein